MPARCVAGYCDNTSNAELNISLHHWPNNEAIAAKWTAFVQLDRKWEGPSKTSTLCSEHFER